MKVYSKIVLGPNFDVIEKISIDYEGPVALAGGGGSQPKAVTPPAGRIVKDLYGGGSGVLADRLRGTLASGADDPYRNMAVQRLSDNVNAQYGARGLATSGIGLKGVTEAITNFDLGREEQKANQAIQILGTGSGGLTTLPGSQPRGLFGLK